MIPKWKAYVVSFIVTGMAALVGSIVTYAGMDGYRQLIPPPLSPPAAVFPIAWTILFILMAIGAARVWLKTGTLRSTPVRLFIAQLVFNVLWSILFFGFGAILPAFICLLILWGLVLAMLLSFYSTDKIAGLIQIPYLIWLTFAAYLNLAIWLINFG